MVNEQIRSMVASFLQTCSCKIKDDSNLTSLGITGDRLRNFKNLIQHNYGSPFTENEYNSWVVVSDIVKTVEQKISSLS